MERYNEVSEELFIKLSAMTYAERRPIVLDMLPDSLIMGYGYYGHRLKEKDGKFYVVTDHGNSCD